MSFNTDGKPAFIDCGVLTTFGALDEGLIVSGVATENSTDERYEDSKRTVLEFRDETVAAVRRELAGKRYSEITLTAIRSNAEALLSAVTDR